MRRAKRQRTARRRRGLLAPLVLLTLAVAMLPAGSTHAAFTDTVPQGVVLVEGAFVRAWLNQRWDENGSVAPLADSIERYAPGGGRLGTMTPEPVVDYTLLVTQLQVGVLDSLTLGVGLPLVLSTQVDPRVGWTPGEHQPQIGRVYSEEDFWEWAGSMGQKEPGPWEGNEGVASDTVLGLRWRFSDLMPDAMPRGLSTALGLMGALPTGRQVDPEEVAAGGTTLWELGFQGDIGLHLSADLRLHDVLDDRVLLAADVFYEHFFARTRDSPEGTLHPLLRTWAPYIGDTYEVHPGDYSGGALQLDVVAVRGPHWATWIVKKDPAVADTLPPLLRLMVQYRFVHQQQADWNSNFALWDAEQEELWRPGYRQQLQAQAIISLFGLGVPLQLYARYGSATLLPGRNARAADVVSLGARLPVPLF